MRRLIIAALAATCVSTLLWAADNAVVVTPGAGVTMRSRDVGAGVQSSQVVVGNTSGNALNTPTAGADTVSNTADGVTTYSRCSLFNGTTWDRCRGDTTNGLWVNVKSATGLAAGSTTAGQTGSLIMGATTTAVPSYTDAQTNSISLDGAGNTRVTSLPTTAGGLTNYFVQPAASDNHANIKNGAGQVYKITITNNSATVNYLRLYNAGSGFNGCNSATNLVYQVAIPANTQAAGISDSWTQGMAFSTGISICVTSGYATNDTTNATASAMSVNIGYK